MNDDNRDGRRETALALIGFIKNHITMRKELYESQNKNVDGFLECLGLLNALEEKCKVGGDINVPAKKEDTNENTIQK